MSYRHLLVPLLLLLLVTGLKGLFDREPGPAQPEPLPAIETEKALADPQDNLAVNVAAEMQKEDAPSNAVPASKRKAEQRDN